MSDAFFRANVGACVVDGTGRVLALQRKGPADGAWQMPQGGIADGETPREAMLRELGEETGLQPAQVEVVGEHPEWLAYELPLAWRNAKVGWGQAQKWFVLRLAAGAEPRADGIEFSACRWMAPAELLDQAVAFRKPTYERVFALARASDMARS